jgi:hypothetical protein
MSKMADNIIVPLDVPQECRSKYKENYLKITKDRGRLMLFAGDQKAEHLNDDFFGPEIDPQDNDPEHLFRIAAAGNIGVFAAQLGLIARFGMDYSNVPYLVKLNSKTNLVKTAQAEPCSPQWIDVSQVVDFKESSGLEILGVGLYHLSGKRARRRDAGPGSTAGISGPSSGTCDCALDLPPWKSGKGRKRPPPHRRSGGRGRHTGKRLCQGQLSPESRP